MNQLLAIICSILMSFPMTGCGGNGKNLSSASSEEKTAGSRQINTDRQIQITAEDGNRIVFALNGSTAAIDLYDQLPLSIEVENYGNSEKIFYPPEKLDISNAPLAKGSAGMLTWYEPWGNVAIYYRDFDGAGGLYELGEAVSGAEYISAMTGTLKIEAAGKSSTSSETGGNTVQEDNTVTKMNVRVGDNTFKATLESNAAAEALVAMMQDTPVVIAMRDYSGFEKAGSLGTSLPSSDSQTTTQAGDIVLYNGNQIVLFYGSNSWSYTRLGRIDDLSGWEAALGGGDVTVTFSAD